MTWTNPPPKSKLIEEISYKVWPDVLDTCEWLEAKKLSPEYASLICGFTALYIIEEVMKDPRRRESARRMLQIIVSRADV